MAAFVLVHAAWHGGWVWKRLTPLLEAAGHKVYTPTLTGLAELAHLATPDVGVMTHVGDIVRLLDEQDLHDVALVGHSYAGMVITGAVDQRPERVARLVYLDACIPEDGQAVMQLLPATRAFANSAMVAGEGWLVPPLGAMLLGVTDRADARWVDSQLTPMPLRTHSEPLQAPNGHANDKPRTFVYCPNFGAFEEAANRARSEGWPYYELAPDIGHDAMVTHPEVIAAILLECAEGL